MRAQRPDHLTTAVNAVAEDLPYPDDRFDAILTTASTPPWPPAIDRTVERLRTDLTNGEWNRRYGSLRRQPHFLGSLCLITALPG